MATLHIHDATPRQLDSWDEWVRNSINGTLFHERGFLAYHGDRFENSARYMVVSKGETPVALISLNVSSNGGRRVTAQSPFGGSYGGFVFQEYPTYTFATRLVQTFLDFLESTDVARFICTMPPSAYSQHSMDTFSFALLEQGFRSVTRDISNIMHLAPAVPIEDQVTSRVRNMARKAVRNGVSVHDCHDMTEFWSVLLATYDKLGTSPTHTLEELQCLHQRFPEQIYAKLARCEGSAVAGVCCFALTPAVNSSFYLCQRPEAAQKQGLSLLLLETLKDCQAKGFRTFDFGTSSHNMSARENLFRFKEAYSPIGVFRETFAWDRERSTESLP